MAVIRPSLLVAGCHRLAWPALPRSRLLYFQVVRVNPTTVALTYVVAILLIATRWGIAEGDGRVPRRRGLLQRLLPPADRRLHDRRSPELGRPHRVPGQRDRGQPALWPGAPARRRRRRAAARPRAALRAQPRSVARRRRRVDSRGHRASHRRHVRAGGASRCTTAAPARSRRGGPAELPAIEEQLRGVSLQTAAHRDPSGIDRHADPAGRPADRQPRDRRIPA